MSEAKPDNSNPHFRARTEIDSWRGRCLDLCARSEKAIGLVLEGAIADGRSLKLRHLAGHRLDDLLALVKTEKATAKQREALIGAIERWCAVEGRRVFLAHGVAKELLDRAGEWHVQFNLTAYKANAPAPNRLTISQSEALEFEEELEQAFKALSAQLGQFRKRLTA